MIFNSLIIQKYLIGCRSDNISSCFERRTRMNNAKSKAIEDIFRSQVRKSSKVKNAYLLVHSDKLDLHLNIAEGATDDFPADPKQPNYMASVGKLFTSTIISILYERGELNFEDSISTYLDEELLDGLHVYKGRDYTDQIKIKHLLKQTSGLNDYFWQLLEKVLEDREYQITTREAIIWGKNNLKPYGPPGKKVHYTDTNYHLLGLIAENIVGKPFHEILKEYIFIPLEMEYSSMLHVSNSVKEYSYPIANFSIDGTVVNDFESFAEIDYAGGGVVATTEDLLKFMQALVNGKIISEKTLEMMKNDSNKLYLGIDYGYGIWRLKTIPIFMPKKYKSWGCVGATGSFMFYHPDLDAYLIGNFNDKSYERKGLRFMLKIIKKLFK